MIKLNRLILFFLSISPIISLGQLIEQNPINRSNASQSIDLKFYAEAVRQYKGLLEKNPTDIEIQFKLGIAYTNSNIDQKKGLELLQKVYAVENKPEGIKKELAIALFKNYKFEEAKIFFEELANKALNPEEKSEYTKWAKQCDTSKYFYEKPIPMSFQNLGKNINSIAPDYIPLVSNDESLIIFTTRREGVVGNLFDYGGYRTSDIYLAKHKSNKYSRSRSIGNPNTYGNEETAGTSANSIYMLYHVDSDDNYSDIFVSEKGRRSYMPPGKFDSDAVNKKASSEPSGSLTNDGSTMFFASDREGGFGGFDLYSVKRLPNGQWAKPINLGDMINTSGDEKFPFIQSKGRELFFSSTGHKGMGGLDLFKSIFYEENWSQPANLGYPLNTVNDDQSICFAKNPRYAYISTKRDDSFGDLDIYRVVFEDAQVELSLVRGSLVKSDSSLITEEVLVEVLDTEFGDLVGVYYTNPKTGHFVAILPPGRYIAEVLDAESYEDGSVEFVINDRNDFKDKKSIRMTLKEKPKPKVVPILEPANETPEIEE